MSGTTREGETVTLEGVLRAENGAQDKTLVLARLERVSEGTFAPVELRRVQDLVLELSDGAKVKLRCDSLRLGHLLPEQRLRGSWRELATDLRAVFPKQEEPVEAVALQLRVASVSVGTTVTVRGVVLQTRFREASKGAFRDAQNSEVAVLGVDYVAAGPDAKALIERAMQGVASEGRSIFHTRVPRAHWYLFAALCCVPVALLPWSGLRLKLWLVIAMSASLVQAGLLRRDHRWQALSGLFDQAQDAPNPRDVRKNTRLSEAGLVALIVNFTSVIAGCFFDLALHSSAQQRSYSMLVGALPAWFVAALVWASYGILACTPSLRTLQKILGAPALHPQHAKLSQVGVFEGFVQDSTPVEGPFGSAALCALTDEEIVSGSDPNITRSSLECKAGFLLKGDDGTVHLSGERLRWASTMFLHEPHRKNDTNHIQHYEVISVGAPALVYGTLEKENESSSGFKTIGGTEGNPPIVLATATDEQPRNVLAAMELDLRIATGYFIVAVMIPLLSLLVYWSELPPLPPGD